MGWKVIEGRGIVIAPTPQGGNSSLGRISEEEKESEKSKRAEMLVREVAGGDVTKMSTQTGFTQDLIGFRKIQPVVAFAKKGTHGVLLILLMSLKYKTNLEL